MTTGYEATSIFLVRSLLDYEREGEDERRKFRVKVEKGWIDGESESGKREWGVREGKRVWMVVWKFDVQWVRKLKWGSG